MDVAVDEHSPLIAVRIGSPRRTGSGMLDGLFAARTTELLPRARDELGQPARLFRPGREAGLGCWTPYSLRGPNEDLVPSAHREPELVERPPEPLEQQRASIDVVQNELRATFTVRKAQRDDLMRGGFVARHDQLQNGRHAVLAIASATNASDESLSGLPTLTPQSLSTAVISRGR